MSIETLAGEAGIHDTWLSMIERGEGNPSWRTLGKLAEQLGVNISDVALLAEKLRAESTESTP